MSSHHRILGIPAHANLLQIKRAYFKKAKVLHPDVNKSPNAESEFIRLNMAYEALTNPRYIHPPVFTRKKKEKTKDEIRREWIKKRNDELRKRATKVANAKRRQRTRLRVKYSNSKDLSMLALILGIIILIPTGINIMLVYHPSAEEPNVAALWIGGTILLLGLFLLTSSVIFLYKSLFK